MKSFEKWHYEELHDLFNLKRVKNHPILTNWLNSISAPLSAKEVDRIGELQNKLIDNVDAWNEDELKSFFIIPLIEVVNFYKYDVYKSFTQRTFAAKLIDRHGADINLRGRVEFLVATGLQSPKKPFFFIHEYKPEPGANTGSGSDPLGQLLATMLAAQVKNEDIGTLHGIYIIRRNWFFVILDGRDYSVSPAYDATQEQALHQIVCLLKEMKSKIESYFS